MFEDIQRFVESGSDLSYGEFWKINQELTNLDWLNIAGELSNEEYLKQTNLINRKPVKNTLNFGKDTKKFSMALNHLFGEKEGQAKFKHESEHKKICERYNINYCFGIMKFNDIKGRGGGFVERTIQPFIQASDEDLLLLKPRKRILFHIENNKAPEDMSSGDEQDATFWKEKLKEFDSNNTSQ